MDSLKLFDEMRNKRNNTINLLLRNIELHRQTINLYEEEMIKAVNNYDLNRVTDIKYQQIPLIESALIKAKQELLKTIALNAFEIISKL
jgi:DNA-binding XRE family transcriptional regulator